MREGSLKNWGRERTGCAIIDFRVKSLVNISEFIIQDSTRSSRIKNDNLIIATSARTTLILEISLPHTTPLWKP